MHESSIETPYILHGLQGEFLVQHCWDFGFIGCYSSCKATGESRNSPSLMAGHGCKSFIFWRRTHPSAIRTSVRPWIRVLGQTALKNRSGRRQRGDTARNILPVKLYQRSASKLKMSQISILGRARNTRFFFKRPRGTFRSSPRYNLFN